MDSQQYVDMYKSRCEIEIDIELYTFRFLKSSIETTIVENIAEIEQGSLFDSTSCDANIRLLYKKDVQHDSSWEIMDIIPFRYYKDIPDRSLSAALVNL